ncbi:Longin domain-containing protein [Heracleum sosnowskyi]|uniref:Longin domain-containing protein n=1 Tax=Heracleum sosnowskyi TaxID=360622 RepID=A0AAD8HHG5_9APIA|nr:Longin domain-containing protein [Heracleum sosnowskyi]
MMSNMYSNMIFYSCIAKGTTILADFLSKNEDLGAIALKCLEKTPRFHSLYSHTVRNRTYLYLIDDPFVYFGIFDVNLEKPLCVSFLKSVIVSFNRILMKNSIKRSDGLKPHCFQGEFDPVFSELVASPLVMSEGDDSGSSSSVRENRVGLTPLLGGSEKNVIKKKRRFFGEVSGGKEVEVSCDDGIALSREFCLVSCHKDGLFVVDKAKRVWKRQLWMVLSLDLVVCCIMFAIWLGICRGFKCISE